MANGTIPFFPRNCSVEAFIFGLATSCLTRKAGFRSSIPFRSASASIRRRQTRDLLAVLGESSSWSRNLNTKSSTAEGVILPSFRFPNAGKNMTGKSNPVALQIPGAVLSPPRRLSSYPFAFWFPPALGVPIECDFVGYEVAVFSRRKAH
jgi:hypothetical protein